MYITRLPNSFPVLLTFTFSNYWKEHCNLPKEPTSDPVLVLIFTADWKEYCDLSCWMYITRLPNSFPVLLTFTFSNYWKEHCNLPKEPTSNPVLVLIFTADWRELCDLSSEVLSKYKLYL